MKGAKSPLRVQSSSFLNFLSSENWAAAGRKDFFDTLKKPPQPELGRLFYDRACKPGSVLTVIYLGVPLPIRSSHLLGDSRASLASSAVLLRIEFTAMDTFTRHRVRSYRTFPPFPEGAKRPPAVSLCCTFPQIALGGRYPLSLPCGARTFLMTGLSAWPRDRLFSSRPILYRKAGRLSIAKGQSEVVILSRLRYNSPV